MVWRRVQVALVAFPFIALSLSCSEPPPRPVALQDLELSTTHDGTTMAGAVGQMIDITLHTIGPGQYGTPSITSSAVAYIDMSFPPGQNPGGPTQVFRFKAVQAGAATIAIKHTGGSPSFSVTVDVQ